MKQARTDAEYQRNGEIETSRYAISLSFVVSVPASLMVTLDASFSGGV